MVTDELLAEGRGGCYSAAGYKWEGPFYGRDILGHLVVVSDQMFGDRRRRPSRYARQGMGSDYGAGGGFGGYGLT